MKRLNFATDQVVQYILRLTSGDKNTYAVYQEEGSAQNKKISQADSRILWAVKSVNLSMNWMQRKENICPDSEGDKTITGGQG